MTLGRDNIHRMRCSFPFPRPPIRLWASRAFPTRHTIWFHHHFKGRKLFSLDVTLESRGVVIWSRSGIYNLVDYYLNKGVTYSFRSHGRWSEPRLAVYAGESHLDLEIPPYLGSYCHTLDVTATSHRTGVPWRKVFVSY
jgi:hypothetical protein